jgi:DNA mismatch endonuclease (patch repair protein)
VADVFTKKKRSRVMAAIRSKGNKNTELKLITIFKAYRITGWRRHQKLHGNPDFVFPKVKVAIFVDGCFWHGCPRHGRDPATNSDYWIPKLKKNKMRDRQNTFVLRSSGWLVLRIWEHELRATKRVVTRVKRMIKNRQNEMR